MVRNTNIQQVLFPVELKPVFAEGSRRPIEGYKAVTGKVDSPFEIFETERVFTIVSDNYVLIPNKDALEMAKDIHSRLFPSGTSDSFEIFNIKTPGTLGSCHIDIIDKHHKLNILKNEIYVPFVRIQNSYNKTMPLRFLVGFCRSICTNGVIFEENSISINLPHKKTTLIVFNIEKIDTLKLKKFETDFMNKTTKADKIAIPEQLFIPLAAKALNIKFNLDEGNTNFFQSELNRLNLFTNIMQQYTDRYVRKENFGETAYALFNVITDYASNYPHFQARTTHDLQNRCGRWLSEFCQRYYNLNIDWDKELTGSQLLNPSLIQEIKS